MNTLYFLSFVLLTIGIIALLKITPEQINKDVEQIFNKREESLKKQTEIARGKKKKNKMMTELMNIRRILKETDKERSFSLACALSVLLMIGGCVVAVMIDNPFLIPVLGIAFAMIPFAYLKGSVVSYNRHMIEYLDTTLSSVTLTYIDNGNILEAVEQHLDSMRHPIKDVFEEFLLYVRNVSPSVEEGIYNMKDKIDNEVFKQWCDQLAICQSDSSVRSTLPDIVNKYKDIISVNAELKTMLAEVKTEYFVMVAMVLGNIPLLYCLNKDWYNALMYTTLGKIVLAITGVVILITGIRTAKLTKPIEYKN